MNVKKIFVLAALALSALPLASAQAGVRVWVGGGPYYRPYGYYRPYWGPGVVVVGAPVVVVPGAVPVYAVPPPVAVVPPPPPVTSAAPPLAPPPPEPIPAPVPR